MATYTRVTDQVNYLDHNTAQTSFQVALPLAPTAGNLVCVGAISYGSSTTMTVQDVNGNNYVVPTGSPSVYDANAGQVHLAYLLNAPANAHETITITWGSEQTLGAVWMREYNPSVSIAFDLYTEGTGTATDPWLINTPTATVTSTNELGFKACAVSGAIASVNSPWTAVGGQLLGGRAGDNLDLDTNTAVAYTGGGDTTWSGAAMTFKDAGGGPASGSLKYHHIGA